MPTFMPVTGNVWPYKASPASGIPVQWSSDCATGMPFV